MKRYPPLIDILLLVLLVLLLAAAITTIVTEGHWLIGLLVATAMAILIFLIVRSTFDPVRLRARQSELILRLATQTLPYMRSGLNVSSAQEVCRQLLPATMANAVAITDRESVIGFAGIEKDAHPIGSPIMTTATLTALRDVQTQVLGSADVIGWPTDSTDLKAAIVVPLVLREEAIGVLKFYYRSPKSIDETQLALAQGFATLMEQQLQLFELEQQRELATQMRFKALQAQINPHFLFNTINTIAALIRTNPARARILLREFAKFYRSTLEGSMDLITLEQEQAQTLRYLGFEIARFGEDRVTLNCDIPAEMSQMLVPSFIIQPLVENAVGHGMRNDKPLRIDITAEVVDGVAQIAVTDDGIGIAKDVQQHMMDPAREHSGIALGNVDERLRSLFGDNAGLAVQSELGKGTRVTLTLGPING
ncbi:MAG: histidine kinase [Coriobacteriales bacterium]|jgi:two-component system sensor histidine kinase LytS|nr:histidine kinase [Coriobacteriales bacterium]